MARSRRSFLYFSLFFAVLIFTRCTSLFMSRRPSEIASIKVLLNRVYANAAKLKTFQGRGSVIASAKGIGMRGTIRVTARMPDVLWMKIEGPLGIDIATAFFNRESVVVYTPLENKVWRGSFSKALHLGYIPNAVDSTNFVLSMVGLPVPSDSLISRIDSVSIDKGKYLIDFNRKDRIWIDGRGIVTRWERHSGDGTVEWVWEGSRFTKKSGMFIPGLVKITSYHPKQQLTILYESIKANKSVKKDFGRINIPQGVKTIER
ncbi:DUF4292 domain-containing protein [bacterium]|nr:DUF4292 domain-containing protein [bacterium]